jgi:hypothetical protein
VGLYPTAELIFGLPIASYNYEKEEYHPLWSEEDSYWSEKDRNTILEIVTYGHYEDPDPLAILSIRGTPRYRADAWDPTQVDDLRLGVKRTDLVDATEQARALGLDLDFSEAGWYLVASYG